MNPLDAFPDSWKVNIEVKRSGGTDKYGDPQPAIVFAVAGCLYDPATSAEPNRDLTRDKGTLYAPVGAIFKASDQVVIPAGALNSGTYSVDGTPKETPLGVEVPLKRGA
jgi:hypothetical protein